MTITCTGPNSTDLGYLLFKNPYRPQFLELNYGRAYIFYPEISERRTTAALLLDIDPIDLVRGKAGSPSFTRILPGVVSGKAMSGRGDAHQALADAPLHLAAAVTMLPCRSDLEMLDRVFVPLGYRVSYEAFSFGEGLHH